MIELKKNDMEGKAGNNTLHMPQIPDISESCCSPEFTEGCIESDPYGSL